MQSSYTRNLEIFEAYKNGIPVSKIAEQYGLSKQNIYYHLNRIKGEVPYFIPKHIKLKSDAETLHKQGHSNREISLILGIAHSTVNKALYDNNRSTLRLNRKKISEELRKRTLEMYKQGNSMERIEFLTGVSRTSVQRFVAAAGISRRKGAPKKNF
jgi:DNA-binding CsgD family transcriptional regulator